jgi:prepilin-type N-terminal cleavage/methylation domain-containing protein
MQRRQAGFTFIEILVVMGIIVVLMGMVAVIVPLAQERARQTESINNVKSIVTLLSERSVKKGWPGYDGKNFTLSVVALGLVDARRADNLKIFFSPGDPVYTLEKATPERYKDIKKSALASGTDFHELTSYAGRRNHDRDFMLTSDRLKMVVPVICDDDDGALHHSDGLVMGYSDGSATFVDWEDLDMVAPDDPNEPEAFLGDSAGNDTLRALSSE